MRLFSVTIVSDAGYAAATYNVVEADAAAAATLALSRYANPGRVHSVEDKGSVVLPYRAPIT